MSATILPAPRFPTTNPFEIAKRDFAEKFQRLSVPRAISAATPFPDDFETIADFIRDFARLSDEFLAVFGREVHDNANCKISLPLFDGVFLDAVDGWATDECAKAAAVLREEFEAQGLAS